MAGDFQTSVDIANRGLQLVGAPRIVAFTDDSKEAAEVSFVYDKLRKTELRRSLWSFSVRNSIIRPVDTNSMELVPAAWSNTATYVFGSIVQFTVGSDPIWYMALQAVPANNEPDLHPEYWSQYFGPHVVEPWQVQGTTPAFLIGTTYSAGQEVIGSNGNLYASITNGNVGNDPISDGGVHWFLVSLGTTGVAAYYIGELVYVLTGVTVVVYVSLVESNAADPTTIPAWSSSTTYQTGHTVTYSAATWQSGVDLNLAQTPGVSASWIAVPGGQATEFIGQNWVKLDATLTALRFIYPAGTGPSSQSATRNVYMLPHGFLREAPQDPKAGSSSFLGAPSGRAYDDWVHFNGFFTSRRADAISYRFAADVANVPEMDEMFCEGLSCRIGESVCETLTQSSGKLQSLAGQYMKFMGEARAVNGIEQGATEPPEDDYITARL